MSAAEAQEAHEQLVKRLGIDRAEIRRQVATWPRLTESQRARLSVLLAPAPTAGGGTR